MDNLAIIACVSQDRGIGNRGDLLWRIPEDMQFFRRTTMGHPVVMGGNTYRSIGKALPGRENIVLSRSKIDDLNVKCFDDQAKLMEYLTDIEDEIFVIGGASIYRTFSPMAKRLILTEVGATRPADTFFPEFEQKQYSEKVLQNGEYEGIPYRIVEYIRKAEDEK